MKAGEERGKSERERQKERERRIYGMRGEERKQERVMRKRDREERKRDRERERRETERGRGGYMERGREREREEIWEKRGERERVGILVGTFHMYEGYWTVLSSTHFPSPFASLNSLKFLTQN